MKQIDIMQRAAAIAATGPTRKIYGAANIKRYLQQQKPDHKRDADTSIADKPHANSREVERRLRQEARRAKKAPIEPCTVDESDKAIVA